MGAFGKYQFWIVFAIYLVKFPVGWHQLNFVIIAPPVNFTCIDNKDKCAPNCTKHIFDRSVFKETIRTQWDLVCERAHFANLVQTITMVGILVGNVMFGYCSDRFGRRVPMIAAVIIEAISGSAAAFIPWYWGFVVLRFVLSTATGGSMITSFVLIMELIGRSKRTVIGSLYQIPFSVGYLSLVGIAYFLRDWRYSQLFISAPSILLGVYYWILPESPRWLVTVGKTEKAVKVMEKAARINKLPTENIRSDVFAYVEESKEEAKVGGNVFDLFKTRNLRTKTCCIAYNWFVCGLCFYGVAQYEGHLPGNMFINVGLSAGVQILGIIVSLITMEKLGRRITLVCSNVIAGVPMLGIPLADDEGWTKPILATVAIFGLMASFTTVYVYCGELFPTIVRNVAIGCSSMVARCGAIVAPFISTLGHYTYSWISPILFGIIPLIGAFLCIWLPETLKTKLPDTIEEAEAVRIKKKTKKIKETS